MSRAHRPTTPPRRESRSFFLSTALHDFDWFVKVFRHFREDSTLHEDSADLLVGSSDLSVQRPEGFRVLRYTVLHDASRFRRIRLSLADSGIVEQ